MVLSSVCPISNVQRTITSRVDRGSDPFNSWSYLSPPIIHLTRKFFVIPRDFSVLHFSLEVRFPCLPILVPSYFLVPNESFSFVLLRTIDPLTPVAFYLCLNFFRKDTYKDTTNFRFKYNRKSQRFPARRKGVGFDLLLYYVKFSTSIV